MLEAGSQRPGCQQGQILASSLVCAHMAFLWCLCAKRKRSGACSSSCKGTNLIRLGAHPYDLIKFMTFSKALSPRMNPLKVRASVYEFGVVEWNRNICSITLSKLFSQGANGVILLEYKADLITLHVQYAGDWDCGCLSIRGNIAWIKMRKNSGKCLIMEKY